MATITLDTHKIITLLHEKGFTKQQAEALVEAAQQILKDVIPVHDSTPLSIETIQMSVAGHYGLSVEEMKGHSPYRGELV